MIKNDISKHLWLLVSAASVLMCSVITLHAFGAYFDVSDEGLGAYMAYWGSDVIAAQQYHYITNIAGLIFGHKLIYYRYFHYLIMALESTLISFSIYIYFYDRFEKNKLYKIASCFSLILTFQIILIWMLTPSYNAIATLSAYFWASALILFLSNSTKKHLIIGSILLSMSILIGTMAKASTGCALIAGALFLTPLFYQILNKKHISYSHILLLLAAIIGGIGCYLMLLEENITSVIYLYTSYGKSSGPYNLTTLLLRHARDIIVMSCIYLPIYAIILYSAFKLSNIGFRKNTLVKKAICYSTSTVLIGIALYFTFTKTRLFPDLIYTKQFMGFPVSKIFSISGDMPPAKILVFTIALGILTLCNIETDQTSPQSSIRKVSIFSAICILAAYAMTAGTYLQLTFALRFASGLIAAPLITIILLYPTSEKFNNKTLAATLAIFFILSIHHLHYYLNYNYYRSSALEKHQNYSSADFLQGIRLEKKQVDFIDKLVSTIKASNFKPRTDRVYVFPASPGFMAASKTKGYGPLWSTDLTSEIDCQTFSQEKLPPDGKLYVLNGKQLPKETLNCLLLKIKESKDFKIIKIGEYNNQREGKTLTYYLRGPFEAK